MSQKNLVDDRIYMIKVGYDHSYDWLCCIV